MNARLAWFRRPSSNLLWNNDAAADPLTGVGGAAIASGTFAPAVRMTGTGTTDRMTFNFGATPFIMTAPAGFDDWFGYTRFALSTSFTPAQAGFIYARVKCARPSTTFYIDPKVTLS